MEINYVIQDPMASLRTYCNAPFSSIKETKFGGKVIIIRF
jgi:hypothetical protein